MLGADDGHIEQIVEAVRDVDGIEVSTSPTAPSCCTSAARSRSRRRRRSRRATTSRWPTRPASRASRRRSPTIPSKVWNLTIKQQHRRRRHRRHGGARARRHRPRGRAAGDGGQGGAVQGVRRHRRLPDLPRHDGHRRDRRAGDRRSRRCSAASTSRTSRRRAASRSRGGCATTLDIPVFHDDQHGTAIVILAALINALRVVGKRLEDVRVVVTGVGAAGVAVTKTLLAAGVRDIVGCDRQRRGLRGTAGLDAGKARLSPTHQSGAPAGTADEALAGADVFIGVSEPGAVRPTGIAPMAKDAIVFAMANPTPRSCPRRSRTSPRSSRPAAPTTRTRSTTCSPSPAFSAARSTFARRAITREMKLAAAQAIAAIVDDEHLAADYIIPSVFNRTSPGRRGGRRAGRRGGGVARRRRTSTPAGA